jgi:hypothetical protein
LLVEQGEKLGLSLLELAAEVAKVPARSSVAKSKSDPRLALDRCGSVLYLLHCM